MIAPHFPSRSTRPSSLPSPADLPSMTSDRTNRIGVTAQLYDETLVADDRCEMRPAQCVEDRLTRKLGSGMLPVSQLQMRTLLRGR